MTPAPYADELPDEPRDLAWLGCALVILSGCLVIGGVFAIGKMGGVW